MSSSKVRKVLLAIESPPDLNKYLHNLVPLGPLGLVSFLESKGIRADLVDLNVTKEFPDTSEYDAVGFSVTNANINPTLRRAELLQEGFPELRIFAGGPGVKVDSQYLCRQPQLDVVIVGEAEPVIYKYLRASDPGRVPGLMVRSKEGKILYTGQQGWVQSLDSLPFPALDRVDFSLYDSPLRKARPFSSIVTSRGCPERCTFCFHPHGYQWRARSAHHVVSEIEWQVEKLGVREIAIYDDTFLHDKARASSICREVKQRGIDVLLQLPQGIRANRVSREILREMKEAGIWLVAVAPESGNPATLQRTKKGFSLRDVRIVVEWCKQLGISTRALFMLGFPWEGEAEVNNTIRFAQELDADITQFTRLTLLPGTSLYEEFAPGSCEYRDQGNFYGGRERHGESKSLDDRFLQRSISRAYRSTTLRPRNILRLMRILPLSGFVHTTRFAIATRNL